MAIVRNTIKFSSGGGSDIIVVANYSALPDPTTVSGQFYWCSASQGTSWLPGSLGGTYYNSGMYYSNGTTWEFINVPYQATQSEVNIGTNTDKFVTPETLKNQNYLATIAYADAKVASELASFKTANFIDFTSSGQTQLDGKVDKTNWVDISNTSTIVGFSIIVDRRILYKIVDNIMFINFYIGGTSNAPTFTFTLPNNAIDTIFTSSGIGFNNGITLTTPSRIQVIAGSNVITLLRDISGATWTNANAKGVGGEFFIRL